MISCYGVSPDRDDSVVNLNLIHDELLEIALDERAGLMLTILTSTF